MCMNVSIVKKDMHLNSIEKMMDFELGKYFAPSATKSQISINVLIKNLSGNHVYNK